MPVRKRSADIWPTLARFLPYLLVYWPRLLFILALLLAVSGFELLRPYLIGRVLDAVSAGHAGHQVILLLGLFLFSVVGRGIALLARNYEMNRTGMRVTCDMRIAIFRHLQSLSIRFYEGSHTGKIVSRVSGDTIALHGLVTGASINMIGDAATIVGVLAILLSVNWKLALVTYAILPFFVFNYRWHRRRLRIESRVHRRNWDRLMGFLHERIASTRLVKAFATEHREIESFRLGIEADYTNFGRVVWRNTLLGVGAETLAGLGVLAVLSYGAYLVMLSPPDLTVGQLASFIFYLGLLYTPVTRIVDSNAMIQQAATSLEKIFALLDTRPHVPENDSLPQLDPVSGSVAFESVSFAYRIGQTTLHDISFRAEPGETIALVGPSGSGKSTVITLLARFYDPESGRVLIDGQDIRQFNVQSLRRQIGIVMQDNILFSGTIGDNIRYGRPDATDAELVRAAEAANAIEFIRSLKNGFGTEIGERGAQLSGGQRQRIAIARVILKDPRILILDEATSALDTESERLVQQALERLMANRTSIVIAHRLSTIVNATRILVLDRGRIAEQGTHEALIARGDLYAKLHRLQFAGEKADGHAAG